MPQAECFDQLPTDSQIRTLIKDKKLSLIHLGSTCLHAAALDKINRHFFAHRPDVVVRISGAGGVLDLAHLGLLTNVRHLEAHKIHEGTGIESVAALPNLESLSIGIFNLNDLSFLNDIVPSIINLSLGATRSKKPDLQPLARFKSLRKISIEGHSKNIEVLGELKKLEDVTLRSVTTPSVEFLAHLPRLWSLDIKLGGTNNLSALKDNSTLKYLELWHVSGLKDISVVSTLRSLQFLFLQALGNIRAIPDLSRLKHLRRVYLEELRGLTDVSGLATAPALEEFSHVAAKRQVPTDYLTVLKSTTLKRAGVGFGSLGKNREFEKLRDEAGVGPYAYSYLEQFKFR